MNQILDLLSSGSHDPALHQKLLKCFEELKVNENGWKTCVAQLMCSNDMKDEARFFCLQILEHYTKTRYVDASQEEQLLLRSFLEFWLQQTSRHSFSSFIQNKVAQVFALTLSVDYPRRWPGFFADLIGFVTNCGQPAVVDLFLRIMMAVDSEVVARDIVHTQVENERNTMIKDRMREQCIAPLVELWLKIAVEFESKRPDLSSRALLVLGAFVSWIDVHYVANERSMNLLLKYLVGYPEVRESVCDCLLELVEKGMEPLAKTQLIDSTWRMLVSAGVMDFAKENDCDYLIKLGKFVNGVGTNLIVCWQKLHKTGDTMSSTAARESVEQKLSTMLLLLGHEDDDVSSSVIPFAHAYVGLLKQTSPGDYADQAALLLRVVIRKFEYDDSYNFDTEGEDESHFQEFRKELKVIFDNIAQLNADLTMLTSHAYLVPILSDWRRAPFASVENSLRLLYCLGEAVPVNFGGPENQTVSMFEQMITLMVRSGVVSHSHFAVSLQFLEATARFDKFFTAHPDLLPPVMEAFLGAHGLHHPRGEVRSRAAYLLARMVRMMRNHVHKFVEALLIAVADVLMVRVPGSPPVWLSADDQLFVYEAASMAIVAGGLPPERMCHLMRALLVPSMQAVQALLPRLSQGDPAHKMAVAEAIRDAMAFAARASKGFSSQTKMASCGCVEPFLEALDVFLPALQCNEKGDPRSIVHAGVRQFLHRMVVCLDEEIFPCIPVAIRHLVTNCTEPRDLYEFVPLISQMVSKFKGKVAGYLKGVFVSVVTTIWAVLSQQSDPSDSLLIQDLKLLRRAYYQFIASLFNYAATEIIFDQDRETIFRVLLTLIEGTLDCSDTNSQKTCFGVLRKVISTPGMVPKQYEEDMNQFLFKHLIPAAFSAPSKPEFDLNDAQNILTLGEAALCLKAVHARCGPSMLDFLRNSYFPSFNMPPALVNEFLNDLVTDAKVFKSRFKEFFKKLR